MKPLIPDKWESRILPQYPRTIHLPWKPNAQRSDLVAKEKDCAFLFTNPNIYVEEKVDGANVGMAWVDGQPVVRNRNHLRGNSVRWYCKLLREEVRPDLRVLCFNCNTATHVFGICPHQTETPEPDKKTTSKPVRQLDISGREIKCYPSAQEADRQTGIDARGISSVLRKKRKTAGGFRWEYVN